MADQEKEAPELQVAKLFQLAGHEVTQAVGAEPGTVDWFATPREGFVRPRTYWRTWKTCPERLDEALTELEQARVARQADRALGVVMEGRLPVEYVADLTSRMTVIISYRRLALELSGAVKYVHKQVEEYENAAGPRHYFHFCARVDDGPIVDAASYIKGWAAEPTSDDLVVTGPGVGWRGEVVLGQAIYDVGKGFLQDIEHVAPLLRILGDDVSKAVFEAGFAIPISDGTLPLVMRPRQRSLVPMEELAYEVDGHDGSTHRHLRILPPTSEQIEQWFASHLDDRRIYERLVACRTGDLNFKILTNEWVNLLGVLDAAKKVPVIEAMSTFEWIAHVFVEYVAPLARAGSVDFYGFEEMALGQFALGRASRHGFSSAVEESSRAPSRRLPRRPPSDLIPPFVVDAPRSAAAVPPEVETWTDVPEGQEQGLNRIVRDYFLACRIAREETSGRSDLMVRYQFPREYVLLFLAILAPDVAAKITADRGEAMRAQIESEVERRLQLTLAHMLKRSAGASRAHLRAIQRHIERTTPGAMAYELVRIEEELSYQSALAEQTRLWREVPQGKADGLCLRDYVDGVVADLRQMYAGVSLSVHIDAALRVSASHEGLKEIVHCLVENAFQAAAEVEGLVEPRVRVEAHADGETIRMDVLDNGPGIAPGDREQIFKPYVTTKKGSDKKPLGTGMGLPIAVRYAEHVGAQVGLDLDREQTCFFVRFVAWRDIG